MVEYVPFTISLFQQQKGISTVNKSFWDTFAMCLQSVSIFYTT